MDHLVLPPGSGGGGGGGRRGRNFNVSPSIDSSTTSYRLENPQRYHQTTKTNSATDMDVGDDGEVFVTKTSNTLSRLQQHRGGGQQQRPISSAARLSTAPLLRSPPRSFYNVMLERVQGLTVTSNVAFTCYDQENVIGYPAGFVMVLYNMQRDEQQFILNPVKRTFTCAAFSHDGKFLVTGEAGAGACVRIWSVRERTQLVELKGRHKHSIACVAFSPRHTKFVVSVGGPQDNYIQVWQWRLALAASLAPAFNTTQNSQSSNSAAALLASNKLSNPISSLSVLQLPSTTTTGGGDTASSTGHSVNDDDAMTMNEGEDENYDENQPKSFDDGGEKNSSSKSSSKRTNILIVTAGANHLKYWYLDAALEGRGNQLHAMRRSKGSVPPRNDSSGRSNAAGSNILPGKSIKLDEIELFNTNSSSVSDFFIGDVASPSLQPQYVICCTRLPTAALLQFHTTNRKLEKWVELKAAHAFCLAIAPYPFKSSSATAAETASVVNDDVLSMRHADMNFDQYQKYEVVFVGCSQGIIRVFDCDTLNVVISSLPRPHWLGVPAIEVNVKCRPAQPPVLNQSARRNVAGEAEVVLPPRIVYPDCIALRYDAEHHHLAAIYSDHSLYIWDVRRLLSEKRIGKLSSVLAHARCIWGLDSCILPPLTNNNMQAGEESTTLLASCSSDNTVRVWSIAAAASSQQQQQRRGSTSSSKSRQRIINQQQPVIDAAPRLELENIIYNTNVMPSSTNPDDDDDEIEEDAAQSTLSIDYLLDPLYDDAARNFSATGNNNAAAVAAAAAAANSGGDSNQGCRCIRLSADGRLLATGYRDGNIRVFQLTFTKSPPSTMLPVVAGGAPLQDSNTNSRALLQCTPLCRIEAHESEVLCLQFHTNISSAAAAASGSVMPHLLASGSRDRLIHLFDVRREFAYITTIDCHSSSITALQFYSTSYVDAVQRAGGVVKGGAAMQRRLYATAKRQPNHELLMLATCGLDKQIMFTHIDIVGDGSGGNDAADPVFEQIDTLTTPCAMYDLKLVKSSAVPAESNDGLHQPTPPFLARNRRPTPAEPSPASYYGLGGGGGGTHSPSNSSSSPSFSRGGGDAESMTAAANFTNKMDLYTANQDQYVRVYDAYARKWVRSFFIETQQQISANNNNNNSGDAAPTATPAAAAIIKLDISPAALNNNNNIFNKNFGAMQQQQTLIAASCSDKTLALYDAVTGEPACVAPFYGHSELVTGLKFINGGRRLVSAAGDATMFIWQIVPPPPAAAAASQQQPTPPSSVNLASPPHTMMFIPSSQTAPDARRRRSAAVLMGNGGGPAPSSSMQDLSSNMQSKLLGSGLPPTAATTTSRMRAAAAAGARGGAAVPATPQSLVQRKQQQQDSDDDDEEDEAKTRIAAHLLQSQQSIGSDSSSVAQLPAAGGSGNRRRSAGIRAETLMRQQFAANRIESAERISLGGQQNQRMPRWAAPLPPTTTPTTGVRRRMAQSVERAAVTRGQHQQQTSPSATAATARMRVSPAHTATSGEYREYEHDDDDDDENNNNNVEHDNDDDQIDDDAATNANIGAEKQQQNQRRQQQQTAAAASGLIYNDFATTGRRRNMTGGSGGIAAVQQNAGENYDDSVEADYGRRRRGGGDMLRGEPRVPSPNRAAMSLQDTLLMLSGRAGPLSSSTNANAVGGGIKRLAPEQPASQQQQQQSTPPANNSNVTYYSVNSDTIRRGTTQQRINSSNNNAASPTSTNITSTSSAALRALQATAERRTAMATAAAAGRQSPMSPTSVRTLLASASPAAAAAEVIAAVNKPISKPVLAPKPLPVSSSSSSSAVRSLVNELLNPMQTKTRLNDSTSSSNATAAEPMPPPRRSNSTTTQQQFEQQISSTSSSRKAAHDMTNFIHSDSQQQQQQHLFANDDFNVDDDSSANAAAAAVASAAAVGAAGLERGVKQRVSLTRRHMKAAKERLSSSPKKTSTTTDGGGNDGDEHVLHEEPDDAGTDKYSDVGVSGNNNYGDFNNNSNAGYVAA